MTFEDEKIATKAIQQTEKQAFLKEYAFVITMLLLVGSLILNTVLIFQIVHVQSTSNELLDKASNRDSATAKFIDIRLKQQAVMDTVKSNTGTIIINQKDGQIRQMVIKNTLDSIIAQNTLILKKLRVKE